MIDLLRIPGFIAFILVAFINAFVDLGHKILIQNTLFKTYDGDTQIILTAVVNGLILLPFILLFTPSGFIADRFAKNKVIQKSAWAAVLITLLITACYYQGWFIASFALTFLLAIQSALYSPAKFGFIREIAGSENLTEGNGWVQAVTMVAILTGIAAFSLMFEHRLASAQLADYSDPAELLMAFAPLGWLLVAGSVIELILSYRLPEIYQGDKSEKFSWSSYLQGKSLKLNLGMISRKKSLWLSIIGLAMFWSVSQVMLAVFPAYAEDYLGQSNTFVIQGAMALAGVGIMLGSVVVGQLSHHYINTGLIPVGAIGVAAGLVLLPSADSLLLAAGLFLMIGFFGSMLTIPLNALLQFNAEKSQMGKVLAGKNFIVNVSMLVFLVVAALFASLQIDGIWLLYGIALIAAIAAVYAIRQLPLALVRAVVAALMKQKYKLNVLGMENLPEDGKGVLLLGNHISWLDWAMIQMASPRHIHFVMERSIYQRWYLKWFMDFYGVIPIASGNSRKALGKVTELLNEGKVVCLFPEGAISNTGQLGEFKRGYQRACEGANGVIVPFYLRGLWGSWFSRSTEKMQRSRAALRRDVIVAFGKPMEISAPAEEVKQKVFELSIHAWEDHTRTLETLPKAFIRTAKKAPSEYAIADVQGEPLSHKKLLTACALFSKRIAAAEGQNIGLLVPTSSAGAIANMATAMSGKTMVNLNFTAPVSSLLSALEQAEIETVVTAHKFVKKLKAKGIDVEPLFAGRNVLYMEDIKQQIGKGEALLTMAMISLLPTSLLQFWLCKRQHLDDTAAILFSSGSEGAPKGVMLSHRNIFGNARQIADVLNVRDDDVWMATLPLFHAFGLTVTCFMPLIEGIPVVCHPDPTDAQNIGKGVARYRATLMCATSTFLRLYTRNKRLQPLMLKSLRLMVAGAEKLNPDVRAAFENKFHVGIVEGYGCTETTPVAGVNVPDYLDTRWWTNQIGQKKGTVGMALPGSRFRIVDPESLEELPCGEAGMILIGGTQIMKGYLNNPDKTAEVLVEQDGLRWYITGDKGSLDEDGFLTIVDRYSRFAKLGGEMVSLTAVETKVREALKQPELPLVTVNLPDQKKGEKVVLLVEREFAPEGIREILVEEGMPGLMIPAEIHLVEQVPVLGSGKPDFSTARTMAQQLAA